MIMKTVGLQNEAESWLRSEVILCFNGWCIIGFDLAVENL